MCASPTFNPRRNQKVLYSIIFFNQFSSSNSFELRDTPTHRGTDTFIGSCSQTSNKFHSAIVVQLLRVDEKNEAQLKLYALGLAVACAKDDSDVVHRSRILFKVADPIDTGRGAWCLNRLQDVMVERDVQGALELPLNTWLPDDVLFRWPSRNGTNVELQGDFRMVSGQIEGGGEGSLPDPGLRCLVSEKCSSFQGGSAACVIVEDGPVAYGTRVHDD